MSTPSAIPLFPGSSNISLSGLLLLRTVVASPHFNQLRRNVLHSWMPSCFKTITSSFNTGRLSAFVWGSACSGAGPRSGELRTQKLKSHLVRIQSLNVLPLKPGIGQYIAIHATLTTTDFFLVYFYISGPLPAFFPKPLPIFPVLAVANTWFLCGPAE